MPSDYKEQVIKYKYAELPEETQYKKKKKKKSRQRSDHKHCYASSIFDCGHYTLYHGTRRPAYYIVDYCVICGRINDATYNDKISNPSLPVFKIKFKDLFAKSINLEDISVC